MTAKVILNPYAGRWNAMHNRPAAEAALKNAGVDFQLEMSSYPGHGIELAAQAVKQGFDPIIAAGGDSTYNEVANGIMQATETLEAKVSFGILPMGTANDLADNLEISKDLTQAAQIIAENYTRNLDVCQVNDRYFVNNSGLGLETVVTVNQSNMKRVHGVFRYILAALVSIAQNPQWVMDIQWDDGEYHGPCTLVSVGNNPRTGGIFYTVPSANPFDGKLTFVHGLATTRMKIIRLLPQIMKSGDGNYTNHPDVQEFHATWIKIHTQPTTPVHSDGEIIADAVQEVKYKIHPGRIPILVRKSGTV